MYASVSVIPLNISLIHRMFCSQDCFTITIFTTFSTEGLVCIHACPTPPPVFYLWFSIFFCFSTLEGYVTSLLKVDYFKDSEGRKRGALEIRQMQRERKISRSRVPPEYTYSLVPQKNHCAGGGRALCHCTGLFL